MELLKFEGHIGGVTQATWSNDESKVLTVSRDYTARIWDAASGAELVRFESVLEATWSQDESRILTVGIDGTARILYTGISDLLAATCRRAPRNFNIEEWNRFIKGPYRPTCEEAPIPSDVIDAIKTQAASETQAGNIPAATVLLSQLDRWLRTNGQYLTFEVETNPYLNLARLLFVADDYAEGIVALANAQVISPTIDITTTLPVSDWNQVCRHGALASVATEVMPACARAVALAPEHGDYRDSRGLALALTGDVPGAIEDFRFFVAWAKTTGQGRNVDWREEWIARLEAGESPAVVFDAATLQRLRNE